MIKTNSGSLAARTVLALVLMIGFYALAIAIAGFLLFVIYLEISEGYINAYLSILCLFAAGVILWSIIPRPERFDPPGPRLDPVKYPRLFIELNSIAGAVSQKMPSEVYLLPDTNAFVAQKGGFLGLGSRRVMGIGLPLLKVLTVSQLRSVLAHEFGHYHGGDTKLGPLVYRTRIMVIRTVTGLRSNNWLIYIIRLPFFGYGKIFLRITLAVSRSQEYSADRLSAKVAGSRSAIQALRTIHGVAPAWEAYWRNEFAPVLGAGFVPPLAEGFGQFLKAKTVAEKVSNIIDQEAKESKTNPYDSHPSLKDRIAALEELPAGAETIGDGPPAISLIDDIPQLEMALLKPIAERHRLPALKPAGWDDITARVYIPAWETTVREQEMLLRGLTPETLTDLSGKIDLFEQRLSGAETWTAEQRTGLVYRSVGAALTLALFQRGWSVSTAPGESVKLSKEGQKIECFEILPRLRSGTLPHGIWSSTCRGLGIAGVDLSRVSSRPN